MSRGRNLRRGTSLKRSPRIRPANAALGASTSPRMDSAATGAARRGGEGVPISRSLARRAVTAAWGVPLVVVLVWLGGYWLLAGVIALIVIGLLEFYRMAARGGYQPIWE